MGPRRPPASLAPGLLARKGGARPAMRPQFNVSGEGDDLAWNDWGTDERPEVLRRIDRIELRLAGRRPVVRLRLVDGRRAAFTLRLDAERHHRLKLAGRALDRSGQAIVTEALDRFLSEIQEVAPEISPEPAMTSATTSEGR